MSQDDHDSIVSGGSPTDLSSSSPRSASTTIILGRWTAHHGHDDAKQSHRDVDLDSKLDDLHLDNVKQWDILDNHASVTDVFPNSIIPKVEKPTPFEIGDIARRSDVFLPHSKKPFHKWMRTLHRRARHREKLNTIGVGHSNTFPDNSTPTRSHHRKSSSDSSAAFITAVKSASISLNSASVVTRSRKNTLISFRARSRTNEGSMVSTFGARPSMDSCSGDRPAAMDLLTTERSLQRRRILEELISTEESYIGDVKFLMNVYVTILASLPCLSIGLRVSINRNLTDIVELHEEILGDLHRVIPHSEYSQVDVPLGAATSAHVYHGHQRWRSLDVVPEDKDGISWLQRIPGMVVDPQVVAEVAKVFSKRMNKFFIYEEYGAKYEMMIKDVASAHDTMPQWESYQKGLETLATALNITNKQGDHVKKALTIGDLLVKPIQRVCKYPLLFAELLKYTPVCDCPQSHMEVEDALIRLREATAEINRATDDVKMKATLAKTWILQDRLVFANQSLDAVSKSQIRSFGHIQLCGVLHVCWQTRESVSGQYMIALLYRDWFCLALAGRADQIYTIHACINLHDIKVEAPDNERGLQCHTAPHSWKIVFICDHQLYELILTACTPKEEHEWRSRLTIPSTEKFLEPRQSAQFNSIALNVKALGTVFGKPGTIARRISVHRATTVGPKTPLCQVDLKNTACDKDSSVSTPGLTINRSQSLLTTTKRIPTLAPPRGERARLEALLSDVWTRDVIPFPGMTSRSRSEQITTSLMRKLSVASIATAFAKRAAGAASLNKDWTRNGSAVSIFSQGDKAVPSASAAELGQTLAQPWMPPLSIISDETERRSTSTTGLYLDPALESLGTVRCHIPAKRHAEDTIEDTQTLRTSSPNTLNRRDPDSKKPKVLTVGSENISEEMYPSSRLKLKPHKGQKRWNKVGSLHRGVVVQGIRSFFR